jgi:hypothetical protein
LDSKAIDARPHDGASRANHCARKSTNVLTFAAQGAAHLHRLDDEPAPSRSVEAPAPALGGSVAALSQ